MFLPDQFEVCKYLKYSPFYKEQLILFLHFTYLRKNYDVDWYQQSFNNKQW